jgi:hypothetical protein
VNQTPNRNPNNTTTLA